MLLNARVRRIVYLDPYDDALARALRQQAGIACERGETPVGFRFEREVDVRVGADEGDPSSQA